MNSLPILVRLSLSLGLLMQVLSVQAAGFEEPIPETTLSIPLGAVFEMMADTDLENPRFSWVLTKDEAFVQAGRDPLFQVRFTDLGEYILSAQVTNEERSIQQRRNFLIQIRPRTDEDDLYSGSGLLAATQPPIQDQGIIDITSDSLLTLVPHPDNQQPLILDLDATQDLDNDGDPSNDQMAEGSFFSEHGIPLYLWLTSDQPTQEIAISGGPQEIILSLQRPGLQPPPVTSSSESSASSASSEPVEPAEPTETIPIEITPLDNGAFSFMADLEGTPYAGAPLLYHWHFGDGQQSLADRPVHQYQHSGTYEVRVLIRDLSTGELLGEPSATLTAQEGAPPPPINGEEPGEPEPSDEESNGGIDWFGWLRLIGIVLLVMLVAALLGFLIALLIRLLRRRGSLKETINKLDSKLAVSEKPSEKSPPPLALKSNESSAKKKEEKSSKKKESRSQEGSKSDKEKSKSKEDTHKKQAKEENAQEEEQQPESRQPENAPPSPPQEQSPDNAAPRHQEPQEQEPAQQEEPQSPPPEPEADAPVPDWLQQGMTQAKAEGQNMHSPPPTPLQESGTQTPPKESTPDADQTPQQPHVDQARQAAPAPQESSQNETQQSPIAEQPAPGPQEPAKQPAPQPHPEPQQNGQKEPLPDWLQSPEQQPESPTQTPPAPEQAPPQPANPFQSEGSQQSKPPIPAGATAPAAAVAGAQASSEEDDSPESPPEPERAPQSDKPSEPASAPTKQEPQGNEEDKKPDWDSMTPEERERERKRQKRRRYRRNKREREQQQGQNDSNASEASAQSEDKLEEEPPSEQPPQSQEQSSDVQEQNSSDDSASQQTDTPEGQPDTAMNESQPIPPAKDQKADLNQDDDSVAFLIQADSLNEKPEAPADTDLTEADEPNKNPTQD